MTQTLQNKLSNSKKARWTALILVSITMMLGYFFTDVMSPLEPLLTEARGLTEAQGGTGFGLGWTSTNMASSPEPMVISTYFFSSSSWAESFSTNSAYASPASCQPS